MSENLPVLHDREDPPDNLKAESDRKAVYVSQWNDNVGQAIGDETKEEWILLEEGIEAVDVKDMR